MNKKRIKEALERKHKEFVASIKDEHTRNLVDSYWMGGKMKYAMALSCVCVFAGGITRVMIDKEIPDGSAWLCGLLSGVIITGLVHVCVSAQLKGE